MTTANQITDHDQIRKWVEDRDGHPAMVRTGKTGGVLRIDFGEPEENLEPIEWEEFFKIFDDSKLAFLAQEATSDGKPSRFNKFVNRDDS